MLYVGGIMVHVSRSLLDISLADDFVVKVFQTNY